MEFNSEYVKNRKSIEFISQNDNIHFEENWSRIYCQINEGELDQPNMLSQGKGPKGKNRRVVLGHRRNYKKSTRSGFY